MQDAARSTSSTDACEPQAGPARDVAGLVAERRAALPADVRAALSERPWGLALSGGGIRSATFCFGLVKALAAGGLLHRMDVMSTVSGGGYIGGTIGRLFQNEVDAGGAPPPAMDASASPTTTPTPTPTPTPARSALDVERAIADADARWFATWLRANGRYLIPRGAKDAFDAAANFGRNFLGVHIEIAIVSALLAGLLVGTDLAVWQFADCVFTRGRCLGLTRDDGAAFGWLVQFPTLWVLLPPVAWLSMVVACAYWSLPSRKDRPIEWQRVATVALMAAAFVVVLRHATHALDGWLPRWTGDLELPGLLVVAALAALAAWIAGIGLAVVVAMRPGRTLDWARNRLTGLLSQVLRIAVAIGALGAIDHLAWWLGNLHVAMQGTFGAAVLLAAVALRAALPKIGDLPKSLAPTARRVVLPVIDAAGVLLLVMVVVFWMSLVHRATSGVLFGSEPAELRFGQAWQWLAWLVVPPLLLAASSAGNREFMNRSSLYTFYRARLVRGYLGAANGRRFAGGDGAPTSPIGHAVAGQPLSDVGDVDPGDDLPMSAYAPHRAGGPVHLVNACVNQTREPSGGLFNQDRKGLLLTIGPNGQLRTQADGWQRPGDEACMTLGSWIAISGAAIAPGLGASTRSGIASILTLAGLRLGYWWDSTSLARPAGRVDRRLGKYAQLFSELQGRFDGDRRRDWFLSDGGHFENTAAYALLREECELVVVADCGADPRYVFGDLENLVRKARIDLQADITFLRPRGPDAAIAAFGSLNDLASADSDACLALARVEYRHSGRIGHLFIVKPNMCHGVSVDLVNFKADNPLFPQEPTTDQLFSEAQWESYFQLGQTLGGKLSLPPMRDAADFAGRYFVDDDGAVVVQGEDGQRAVRFSSKRLSSRVAATGAVSATISLGAVTSIGLAAWQGVSGEIASASKASIIEPGAYKELTDIFGKLPPPATGGTTADRDTRLGEMATALLRVGDAACTADNLEAFRRSKLMRLMVDSTRDGCRQAESPHWSCADLRDDNKLPACLQETPRNVCMPMYWTRDYASAALDSANCWTPSQGWVGPDFLGAGATGSSHGAAAQAPSIDAALPGPGPASGADAAPPSSVGASAATTTSGGVPAVASSTPIRSAAPACVGYTVYLQIYGPEQRDRASGLREPWRRLGATVPPVEDVADSARRAGRRVPQPYAEPTVVYYDDAARACTARLSEAAGTTAWSSRRLDNGSDAQRRVIEVWVTPDATSGAGSPGAGADAGVAGAAPIAAGLDDLMARVDAPAKPARLAAVNQLIARYQGDPRMVALATARLQPPLVGMLSASGRINLLVLLRNATPAAWTADNRQRARAAIASARADASTGVPIGPQTEQEFARLVAFLEALPPVP